METSKKELRLGIDVGSTTVKVVVVDPQSGEMLYSDYRRHHARQMEAVAQLLNEIENKYPDEVFRSAVCGSGGKPVAQCLNTYFIQEVVANAAAVCRYYPKARTAIELGGQDAKIVFFENDKDTGKLRATDMRMNGSCAGGTGAFIDEIASLLDIEPEEYEELAAAGEHVFDISGRCGVFAKTDVQPLLIQGAKKEDIALSAFHAIAKQTIGGLSQGLELKAPIIFEGGPLTFHPTLVRVFAERLDLKEDDIIIPKHPETIVAMGTAIAIDEIFPKPESGREAMELKELSRRITSYMEHHENTSKSSNNPFFKSSEERQEFENRHNAEVKETEDAMIKDNKLSVYLGVDSGSTTSKMVLLDEKERVVDRFYSGNKGEALNVVRDGIQYFYEKYEKQGIELDILGLGTTGYGEKMLAKAFGADYHIVETVAHAHACTKYFPDATFLLDIGGQDMKAIWLDHGVITNIMLNEACSSGCGSFLETFADNLGIKVEDIGEDAFSSKNPAALGSRCTVFMNSTIINEQRNGKNAEDIMAGLCRSIIENVFTKVVRISNIDELGDKIVVQGGTFRNPAVLRALEEYLGKDVILSPYSGEMGALGAALLAKQHIEENGYENGRESNFIGRTGVEQFKFETHTGVVCPRCANHCSRTIMTFSNGESWITGNRCERGAVPDDDINTKANADSGKATSNPKNANADSGKATLNSGKVNKDFEGANINSGKPYKNSEQPQHAEDLFAEREELLFKKYDYNAPVKRDKTIGMPRVLEFWDSMPFWSTFFRALGFNVKFSHKSNRKMYESGLEYVASDTICFPAKLVHGHILDLANQKVDRIFMPYVMHMPPEGKDKLSPYVCSVVMGYPMVVRNSQNPEEKYNVKFDTPIFHWFSEKNRKNQICEYAMDEFGIDKKEVLAAYAQAENAIKKFRDTLTAKAEKIIEETKKNNSFAVVLAGRPYHTDPFVSHDISRLFAERGISVLPVDSLPGRNEKDLKNARIEITNNFHTRMLEGAVCVAENPELEYVQLVSFGCGHDAVLSDEIIRIMTEGGDKPPLILKVDESQASGSLGIRVESFIESVKIRRKLKESDFNLENMACEIPEPSPAKFYKKDKKVRTLLIPNISEEVSTLLCAVLEKENFIPKSVLVGGTEQVKLGKKYVHNDICFPCQMVIGELISALQKGNYNQDEVAVGMVKFQCDCRMSHYAGLLRKGLDAAGFKDVPIVTTDVGDTKDMHPGVALLGISAVLEAVWTFEMLDIITELCRKIRPYEINKGETDRVYKKCVDKIAAGIRNSISAARKAFEECIDDLSNIPYDRSTLKPRVFVTGELLVTYHPGSNFNIEKYLESNGLETIFPRITDQLRKDFRATECEISEYHANIFPYPFAVTWLFDEIQKKLEKVAIRHPLYKEAMRPKDMYKEVSDIIPETLSCGEGWLMAAEIAHYAKEGVKSFVILQPFGCLPNHICGRGTIKKLKEKYPGIQILPLDLDPDTSYANVENRLQMLIMNKSDEQGELVAAGKEQ